MMSCLSSCFPCFSRRRDAHRDDDDDDNVDENHQFDLLMQQEVEELRVALYTQLYGRNPETPSLRTNEEIRALFRAAAVVRRGGVPEDFVQEHLRIISYRVPEEPTPSLENEEDVAHHCSICLDGFTDGQSITSLGCRHNFHFICLKKWLVENNSCPLCREKAVKAEFNVFDRLPDIIADHRRV